MLSNQQRGRNIANDTAVQSVFLMLQHMYPELHRLIKSLDDKQGLTIRLMNESIIICRFFLKLITKIYRIN
jgi:Hepatocyte growth factor-regulated tyrosine kinase substrate